MKEPDVYSTEQMLEEMAGVLSELVFECDGIFDTRKPSVNTYNKAFTMMNKYRKQKEQKQ